MPLDILIVICQFQCPCICWCEDSAFILCLCFAGDVIIQTCDWQGAGQQEGGHGPAKSSYLL